MENVQHQLNHPIDENLFKKREKILALEVESKQIGILINELKSHLLNRPRTKNAHPSASSPETHKILLLSKRYEADALPEALSATIDSKGLKLTEFELIGGYEDFSYSEALEVLLPKEVTTPGGYEVIGHLAHLNLRPDQFPYKYLIGKVILDKNKNLKTVVNKLEKLSNEFRTPVLELIAGDKAYETVHIEGGLRFTLDFEKVYWCSRLHYERERILKTLKSGETICDAFCGIGPFALRAAKEHRCTVYASDLNPECYRYLKMNIKKNKLSDFVIADCQDARIFIKDCLSKMYNSSIRRINRFYMNLPADAIEFLDCFVDFYSSNPKYLAQDQFIEANAHTYCFLEKDLLDNQMNALVERISKVMPNIKREDVVDLHCLKSVSSEKEMFCVTLKLTRQNCSESLLVKRSPDGEPEYSPEKVLKTA